VVSGEFFRALSDPVRREILGKLQREGKLSAGQIAEGFDLKAATISYHLSKLKQAKLVRESRYKNYIYYEIYATVFEEALLWLREFLEERERKSGE
jgi:ArsR family transcriptional regulator